MSFPNLSALAVRERAVTLFFLILAVIGGVYAFLSLGRAEDPSFTVRVMMVSAVWPGATPQELQEQVVDRLEKRIQEVEYLYRIETTIRPGRADLQIEFEDYAPQDKVPDLFYQVRKRMQDEAGHLPQGVIGPIVNDDFSDVYFKLIALTAPGMPMRELTREAEAIRDRLQRTAGVHKAIVLGERTERVYVEFDNARLVNLGITPQAISDAIDANNRLIPAGRIETDGPRLYLRIDADLSDPAQLAAVPIRIGERLLRLSDIATIRRGYEDPPSYLVRSRGEDAVLLGVVIKAGENGLEVGKRLTRFVEDERARLPLGITLAVLTDQAEAIAGAVNLFQFKFLIAVAVVVGVSILALGLRAGLVVGIAVPLTLGITFLVMKLMGINLDRITLGALIIALGLLVDDAIISVEMMLVKMEQGWDRVRAAAHAWSVTAAPMLFGTLVTVAGFFPIGFAQSGVGEYAGNIFWVLGVALLVSWFVAVTFVPYLGVKLLPGFARQEHGEADIYQKPLYRRLRALISWCVDLPKNRGCQYGGAARAGDCGACRTGAEAVLPRVRPPGSAGQRLSAARQQRGVCGPHHAQARGHPRPHAGGQDPVGLRGCRGASLLYFRQPRAARSRLRQADRRDARCHRARQGDGRTGGTHRPRRVCRSAGARLSPAVRPAGDLAGELSRGRIGPA